MAGRRRTDEAQAVSSACNTNIPHPMPLGGSAERRHLDSVHLRIHGFLRHRQHPRVAGRGGAWLRSRERHRCRPRRRRLHSQSRSSRRLLGGRRAGKALAGSPVGGSALASGGRQCNRLALHPSAFQRSQVHIQRAVTRRGSSGGSTTRHRVWSTRRTHQGWEQLLLGQRERGGGGGRCH